MTDEEQKKSGTVEDGAVPEFMSEMVDDMEYIPRNERLGRAARLKRKRNKNWFMAAAAGAIVLIVVLAVAFDSEDSSRTGEESLEAGLLRIEERLKGLENKIARLEERMNPGLTNTSAKPGLKSQEQYHTVRPGDSLSEIAAKYGLTVDILCRLNRITVDQPIKPDQKLLVSPN